MIQPNREIKQFQIPVKPAELMLEIPDFFMVNTKSLQIGRGFSALNAYEDLEIGNSYVMFPMKRLKSLVMAADMDHLLLIANSAVKRKTRAKILLDSDETLCNSHINTVEEKNIEINLLNLDDREDEYFSSTLECRQRRSFCGSKKPLLETIAEEPVCSR